MVIGVWSFVDTDYSTPKYWPEDHNLCLAYVEFNNGNAAQYLWSYSNMSRIRKKGDICKTGFVADVNNPTIAPGGLGIYHTEPRLLNYIIATYNMGTVSEITLTTARDCCTSCQKVIAQFRVLYPAVQVHVYELNAQNFEGMPQSKDPLLK